MKDQRTTVTTTKQQRPIHAEHKRSDSTISTAFRVLDFFHDFMIVDVIDENAQTVNLNPIKVTMQSNGTNKQDKMVSFSIKIRRLKFT